MQTKVTSAETDLVLHQCVELLRSHGFQCYITVGNGVAVEIQMCTLRGTYITFTEYCLSLTSAYRIINDYREGNYDFSTRG